jgi:hypothetical protein
MTKRHAKPTSAKKRKPPTTAQMVGRIPKWLTGFEERLTNQMKAMQRDNEKNARLLEVILYDSKGAREDNLPTLPRLHRAIENGDAHLRVTARTLVDHCARLLKEKETLQRQVANMKQYEPPCEMVEHFARAAQIDGADLTFSGEPRTYGGIPGLSTPYPECLKMTFTTDSGKSPFLGVLGGPCTLAHLHRPGIRCGVCGEVPDAA